MGTSKTKLTSGAGKRAGGKATSNGDKAPKNGKKNGKNKKNRALKALAITACVIAGIALAVFIIHEMNVKPPEITPPPTVSKAPPKVSGEPNASGRPDEDSEAPNTHVAGRKDDVYTVLLTGSNSGLTDVLMIATFDTVNKTINVMNIPRDTYVGIAKRSVKKINGAYNTGGMEMLLEEVESLIGFMPDNYVHIDMKGFEKFVESIGGVDYNVPFRMWHPDAESQYTIDLQAGQQRLNGKQALMFVRFRNDKTGGDYGRIERCQEFLTSVAKQTLKFKHITKIGEFAEIFAKYVDMDLTIGELTWFAEQAMGVDMDNNLHFHTMPGGVEPILNGVSYIFGNEAETLEIINESINPLTRDLTADDLKIISYKEARGSSGGTTTKPTPTPTPKPSPAPSKEPNDDETIVSSEPIVSKEPTAPAQDTSTPGGEVSTEPSTLAEPTGTPPPDDGE